MGGWKRGSDTDPQMAKWGNLFFLISLSITIWGVKAFPVLWILSLLMTPLLGVFFLMNLGYGLPKIFGLYCPLDFYQKRAFKTYKILSFMG